ncbi:MAG: hypothetical protein HOP12_15140 [Candidatus Eisenbacteria bacterium]|uniref:Uncharacterized protein n=1 Tax=Eiseniibacteriota bacterium TaxID=2212470 RepID=A0A849T2G6_UNCEI|nr:hypothetical protein [Candidatus Eisenbacteria bacterium]
MGRYEFWRLLRRALLLAALAGFLFAVWPTPWRHTHITLEDGTYPVRIHRVTGEAQMLTPEDGWWQMGSGDPNTGEPRGGTTS